MSSDATSAPTMSSDAVPRKTSPLQDFQAQWSSRAILQSLAGACVYLTLLYFNPLMAVLIGAIAGCAAGVALAKPTLRVRRFAASCAGLVAATVGGTASGVVAVLTIAFNGGSTKADALGAGALIGAWAGLALGICTIAAFGAAWLVWEGLERRD